jgi:hypothetical protein
MRLPIEYAARLDAKYILAIPSADYLFIFSEFQLLAISDALISANCGNFSISIIY